MKNYTLKERLEIMATILNKTNKNYKKISENEDKAGLQEIEKQINSL